MSTSFLGAAAARSARNPRTSAGVALALVFLCGSVVGALAIDLVVHSRQRPPVFETLQGKAATFARMQKELDLTPAQSEQMASILDDFWQYYQTVISEGKQRIEQILTPEQKAKFEQLLLEPKK